jgi:hypothetical protein
MDGIEFRCFLDLLMCSDPWPVKTLGNEMVIKSYANDLSTLFGYSDWIEAYHDFNPDLSFAHSDKVKEDK